MQITNALRWVPEKMNFHPRGSKVQVMPGSWVHVANGSPLLVVNCSIALRICKGNGGEVVCSRADQWR